MASGEKVFVRVANREDVWKALSSDHQVTRDGDWAELEEDEVEQEGAKELSARFDVPVVYWCINTVVDLICLIAYRRGKQIRELLYTGDSGWLPASGRACAFENKPAIRALRQRKVSASPDGYDVLAAFLGRQIEQEPEPIADADATQRFYLSVPVATDVQQIAAKVDASIGAVLEATWEVAKGELHRLPGQGGLPGDDEEALDAPPVRDVGQFCSTEPRTVPPLPDTKGKVKSAVAMKRDVIEEIRALSAHLDRPMSWVVNEAYVRGRAHLKAL